MEQQKRDAQMSEIWKTWKDKMKNKAVDYLQGDDWTEQQFRFDPKELQKFWDGINKLQDMLVKVYDYSYKLGKLVDKDESLQNIVKPLYQIADNSTKSASTLAKLQDYMKVKMQDKNTSDDVQQQPEQKQVEQTTEDVMPPTATPTPTTTTITSQQAIEDAIAGLIKIGYNKKQSADAVKTTVETFPAMDASELFNKTIKFLNRG